ncbi:MAG: hypothetical protein K1X89_13425 [Myxococcaceae bacterium]|nr:hypothetical protein [Myxococcaceae bacterium]
MSVRLALALLALGLAACPAPVDTSLVLRCVDAGPPRPATISRAGDEVELDVSIAAPQLSCDQRLDALPSVRATVDDPDNHRVAVEAKAPTLSMTPAPALTARLRFRTELPGSYHVTVFFEPVGSVQLDVAAARVRSGLDAGEPLAAVHGARCRAATPLPFSAGVLCEEATGVRVFSDAGEQRLSDREALVVVEAQRLWVLRDAGVDVWGAGDAGELALRLSSFTSAPPVVATAVRDGGIAVVTFTPETGIALLDLLAFDDAHLGVGLYTSARSVLLAGHPPALGFWATIADDVVLYGDGRSLCTGPLDAGAPGSCPTITLVAPVSGEPGVLWLRELFEPRLGSAHLLQGVPVESAGLSLPRGWSVEPRLGPGQAPVIRREATRLLPMLQGGALTLEAWEDDGFEVLGADSAEVRGLRPDGTWVRIAR